jgi:hypothetical protein
MDDARKQADIAVKSMDKIKTDNLSRLTKAVEEAKTKILTTQDDLIKKAKQTAETIRVHTDSGQKMYMGFEATLLNKVKLENMMDSIDKDKDSLKKSLEEMKKEMHSFDLMKKSASLKTDMKDIEKSIKDLEKKKE